MNRFEKADQLIKIHLQDVHFSEVNLLANHAKSILRFEYPNSRARVSFEGGAAQENHVSSGAVISLVEVLQTEVLESFS